MDFVRRWSEKTEIGAGRFIGWLDITASKFLRLAGTLREGERAQRLGSPRLLEDWQKHAIIGFHLRNPLEGYHRLTFMMLDSDMVAASPTSVWRVLGQAGLLSKWSSKPSKKGTGFKQPLGAHQHLHIDVSYINISGTFHYLLQHSGRLLSLHRELGSAGVDDRGGYRDHLGARQGTSAGGEAPDHLRQRPQFITKDFKEFIRVSGMTRVRTSPYYPQSNGKIARWHKSLKGECIRPGTPLSLEDARRLVAAYVEHYNYVRLNSAIGYIAPKDMFAGRQQEIHAERDRKVEGARKRRQIRRQAA